MTPRSIAVSTPTPSRPGVKMFSERQSSPGARAAALIQEKKGSASWGAAGPERAASRTPAQGVAGCGGRKRSDPVGAAAYGTPRKTYRPRSLAPWSRPALVSTTVDTFRPSLPPESEQCTQIFADCESPGARVRCQAALPERASSPGSVRAASARWSAAHR